MKKYIVNILLISMLLLQFVEPLKSCTSITAGKLATKDGSVFTSHTCDSHRTRTSVDVKKPRKHKKGSMRAVHVRENNDSGPMPKYDRKKVGEIPEVEKTYGYINTAYGCLNDHQLAIGESTFGGREELRSEKGLLDCVELCALMMERCKTSREAIRLIDELTKKYGYNDKGECLTIADKNEVWHLEIVGPGKDKIGAVWAAVRIPDDHVSLGANGSRLRKIDLSKPDEFLASENIFSVAAENGWWNEEEGPFEFCYAYAPEDRKSISARRREWRVLSLVAPSLKLDPNSENYPFSVKPDSLVTVEKLMEIFGDYYEDTDFDMTKSIIVPDSAGKMIKSPLANPFMPYDMGPLFKINGGWGWRGERTIARWYCVYVTIIQLRANMPDPVGGVVWLGFDNPAMTTYVPFYSSTTKFPAPYKVDGRNGYSRNSAWWAFNRSTTLAAQRWGDMRKDVDSVRFELQSDFLNKQSQIETEALRLHKKSPKKAIKYLTEYSNKQALKTVEAYWNLGDLLWTKYDEKF